MDIPFDSKPVIVIDEFQYIGRSNPAFPSVFQRIWEEQLKDRPVMVILCGSLVSMMVSQPLHYGSPLYGRRTAQIRLRPIPFRYYHGDQGYQPDQISEDTDGPGYPLAESSGHGGESGKSGMFCLVPAVLQKN